MGLLTIWKYTLRLDDNQTIDIPEGHKILHFGIQFSELTIWVRVNPDATKRAVRLYIVGTGHSCPDDNTGEYVGTVQQGQFVWHLWEAK